LKILIKCAIVSLNNNLVLSSGLIGKSASVVQVYVAIYQGTGTSTRC